MTRSASRIFPATVAAIERLTPHFARVTFTSPELADVGVGGPDQRIKVIFPLPGAQSSELPAGEDWYAQWRRLPDGRRNPMRTYTIRHADPVSRRLVVDFVAHGDSGPASRWITHAAPGQTLLVVAPDAGSGVPSGGYEWNPGRATTLLIAGDETAAPAICAIIESLDDHAQGAAFIEVPQAEDVLPITAPPGIELTWLFRDTRHSAGHGELVTEAVQEWADAWMVAQTAKRGRDIDDALLNPGTDVLWEVPPRPGDDGLYAWLAGEAGAITGLRRHLVHDLGIARSRIAFMGYWKLGRAEN
ncbi:siderophore-interacting protein [Compostimonas suwonensis]|uniref:NADPH-dependent ferric siderophore reductase n=1 Tax=Compostimonas suwonensis TaxID=1048394 RepID=A0A2M9BWQ7_9MICO|nr:siderophore-interacting protein [Compostimonas suwonensis]PJJ62396.1 NADPH-dependent ferric siderophore reductase [Compostimonas suwonensis]